MSENTNRLTKILSMLAVSKGSGIGGTPVCEVATQLTGCTGACIMLLSDDQSKGSLCRTDDEAAFIEDSQYTLGEGPSIDAYLTGRSVHVDSFTSLMPPRWPVFTPLAIERGIEAIFAFPVRIGAVRLGALNVYRTSPGALSTDQRSDALVLADVAARTIVALQAYAAPGALASEIEEGANFHFVVHQSAGMLSEQLGISVQDALIRIRARAFTDNRPIDDVAADIVRRELRFEGESSNDGRD
jgi:GAF domain-containing protein